MVVRLPALRETGFQVIFLVFLLRRADSESLLPVGIGAEFPPSYFRRRTE